MDGHAEPIGSPLATCQLHDWPEARGQADLFDQQAGVTEPLGDVNQFDALGPSAAEAQTTGTCAGRGDRPCILPGGRDFFHGGCLPYLESTERDRFLENCLKAQEQDRLQLGRELHDSTGQLVLALRLGIAHLRRVHGTAAEESALTVIDETARQLDREIRSFSFLHYPSDVGTGGLVEALQFLVHGFQARTGLHISFRDLSHAFIKNSAAAVALLRVAQEALMNVHRHAHAKHVLMSLAHRDGALRLTVRDDGIGIPAHISEGVGIQGMRHRVERLGGEFSIRSRPRTHGTELVASVPA